MKGLGCFVKIKVNLPYLHIQYGLYKNLNSRILDRLFKSKFKVNETSIEFPFKVSKYGSTVYKGLYDVILEKVVLNSNRNRTLRINLTELQHE